MIYINPNQIHIPSRWKTQARQLTRELKNKPLNERTDFIESKRLQTWGHRSLVNALKSPTVAGNKCWYSEVLLAGADVNVDHFRPKGRVREVDASFTPIATATPDYSYWWLAFEPLNYRLSSMHSNQRRVDEDTCGGKWNYFPLLGARAVEGTHYLAIQEDVIPLDPCSLTDVKLLFFDLDGTPCYSQWRDRATSMVDKRRVDTTIWLYHLKKVEIRDARSSLVEDIKLDLDKADTHYTLWNRNSTAPSLSSKNAFEHKIAEIKAKLVDTAEFARAKRCAVRLSIADYEWIEEFELI